MKAAQVFRTQSAAVFSALLVACLISGYKLWSLYTGKFGDPSVLVYPDEQSYYLPAAKMILDQGFSFFLTPRSLWNGPMNPLWIALWDANVSLVKAANLGLIGFSGLLVFDATRRLFGRAAGLLALVVFLLHRPLAIFGPTLLTEPPFVLCLCASLWCFVLAAKRESIPCLLLSGLAMGVAALTRPTVQVFPVFLAGCWLLAFLWGLARSRSGSERSMSVGTLIVFCVGFFLLVAPYAVKNYLSLHKVGIANGFGAVLYLGNDLRTDGDEPIYSELNFSTWQYTQPYAHLDSEGDKILLKKAIEGIEARPKATFLLWCRKAFRYMFGGPDHYFYPQQDLSRFYRSNGFTATRRVCFELATVCFVTVFGLFGLAFVSVSVPGVRLFCLAMVGYLVSLHAVAFPIPRLAIPMFPFLLVFAAGFLVSCVKGRREALLGFLAAIVTVAVALGIAYWNYKTPRGEVGTEYTEYFDTLYSAEIAKAELTDLARGESGEYVSKGRLPALEFELASPIQPAPNQVFFISYQIVDPKGLLKRERQFLHFFWSSGEKDAFREEKSRLFEVAADGEEHIVRISPSVTPNWTEPVTRLRLKLIERRAGVRYRIRSISLAQ